MHGLGGLPILLVNKNCYFLRLKVKITNVPCCGVIRGRLFSMPVLSMHETAANWDDSLANGQEMLRPPQNMGPGVARASQDDALVGYMFQRPPTDSQQPGKVSTEPTYASKAWLGRERTGLEQVASIVLLLFTYR